MKRGLKQTGFTVVELLIVIVVISVLASLTIVVYGKAQGEARDVARMVTVKKISDALKLYYFDNRSYPAIEDGRGIESTCGSQTENWGHCDRMKTLTDALAPYDTFDPASLSNATQGNYFYAYASQAADNRQSYGLMVYLEGDGGADDKGAYANAYEVGDNPPYCSSKYTGTNANWLSKPAGYARRCQGGD